MARTSNTRFGRSANALNRTELIWSSSIELEIISFVAIYAEISAWYIKPSTMKLGAEKIAFSCIVLYYSSLANSYFKQSISWKQPIRFFIEYGTVEKLGERTDGRPVIDPSYQNNLRDRCRFLT